jgi:hypothetical protein
MFACWKSAAICFATAMALSAPVLAADTDTQASPEPPRRLLAEHPLSLFDFRVLQASPGKLDALHARLRDQQIPFLEQHGIFTLGVFVPAGENPNQLVYLLTGADGLGTMTEGWADLREDPKWLHVVAETDKDGRLVAQESHQQLRFTAWSPKFPPDKPAQPQAEPNPRVFELRTYTCPDRRKHSALMRRFREHTMNLFAKHGMTNIVYWVPDEEPESWSRLVYLLAHDSQDAARKSFEAFRSDPEWLAAKKASEEVAGGSLTNPDKGVVSEFLTPAEYSPLK